MDEIETLFGKGIEKTPFEQIDELTTRVTNTSQQLLRSVWEEVKNGEPAFQVTKWITLGVAIIALVILAFGMAFQVSQANRTPLPTSKCMQSVSP